MNRTGNAIHRRQVGEGVAKEVVDCGPGSDCVSVIIV